MEVILTKFAALLLSMGMLVVAWAIRRVSGTWLAPACLYCIAWFLFSFIPMLVALNVPVNPLAIAYILATCVAFALPTLASRWSGHVAAGAGSEHGDAIFDTDFLRITFVVFSATAILSLVVHTAIQGVQLGTLTTNFFEVSNSLIADRYNETTTANIFSQISNIATYTAVALAGFVVPGLRTAKQRVLYLAMAMLPPLAVMVVFGAKGMIFLCIAMFFAGILIRRLSRGDSRLISVRDLVRAIALAIFVIIPATTLSFVARGLYEAGSSAQVLDGLYRYFVSYTSAHIFAFSDWFSWYIGYPARMYYSYEEPTMGFYTFMSVFKFLGDNRFVPAGVYTEYYQYGYSVQSNVYTMFRGLITDFTILGSLAICLISGAVCNAAFNFIMTHRRAAWSISLYVCAVAFIYTSFIISLLIWNSIYPTFLLVGVLLTINNERFERSRSAMAGLVEVKQ